jgi:hypothetical protein
MAWIRQSGWSSDEEHFVYDAAAAKFVEDPRDPYGDGELPATHTPVVAATYLQALAEIRRAVQRQPATQWEAGILIRLYAEATALAEHHDRDEPRFGNRYSRIDPVLAQVVAVAEAVLVREHPDQVAEIAEISTQGRDWYRVEEDERVRDVAERMNGAAANLDPTDGGAIRAIWLASFDRPGTWEQPNVEKELHAQGPGAVDGFIASCADLARNILAAAGPIATALTTGAIRIGHADEPGGTP